MPHAVSFFQCETPHLTEERLKELFLIALGEYLSDRNAAIDQLRCAQRTLTDTDFIDADIQTLEEELTGVVILYEEQKRDD